MTDLEQQLARATASPEMFGAGEVAASRIDENLLSIHAELDAPRESRLARLLRRLGVSDLTVPLVTATPALRRSWFVAVAIAVLFALTTASNNTVTGVDRIVVFLTLAPLVPLLGVALAFGKGVDPTHDLVVAAPRDTFTVFLIRAITVLSASATILLLSSLLLPEGGAYRFAWLLPALAITGLSMVLSTRYEPRRVAALLCVGWLAVVIVISGAVSVSAMFGPVTQLTSAGAAAVAAGLLFVRRGRLDASGADV